MLRGLALSVLLAPTTAAPLPAAAKGAIKLQACDFGYDGCEMQADTTARWQQQKCGYLRPAPSPTPKAGTSERRYSRFLGQFYLPNRIKPSFLETPHAQHSHSSLSSL